MRNVAIVGEFASGKTTLAKVLVEKYGYTRISFASRLKQVAADVYNFGNPVDKNDLFVVEPLTDRREVITGRQLLQQLGQAVKIMDRNFWIRWLFADIERGLYGDGPFVIDDCRFPYEAEYLRNQYFLIVRLNVPEEVRMNRYEVVYGRRPTEVEMNHPSETEVKDIEYDLALDGTQNPEELAEAIVTGRMEVAA